MTKLVLTPEPTSPGTARRAVERELGDRYPVETIEVATLLTTELVTNAVVHARTAMVVTVAARRDRVRVEVEDGSSELRVAPPLAETADLQFRGRGLILVERLADAWGIERSRAGKTVWFELLVSENGRGGGSLSRSTGRTG